MHTTSILEGKCATDRGKLSEWGQRHAEHRMHSSEHLGLLRSKKSGEALSLRGSPTPNRPANNPPEFFSGQRPQLGVLASGRISSFVTHCGHLVTSWSQVVFIGLGIGQLGILGVSQTGFWMCVSAFGVQVLLVLSRAIVVASSTFGHFRAFGFHVSISFT